MFDDLLDANKYYQHRHHNPDISGVAARGLAVLTCIDSRIDPLAMLGLRAGDAKIIRTAGARVTDDALRALVLATNLLGVHRICVVPHTDCAMAGSTEEELAARVAAAAGYETDGWTFLADPDQEGALATDLARIHDCPLIDDSVEVGGFLFDVHTGELTHTH